MGKRELVIALAFTVMGVMAYVMTAPPPKPSEQGLSLTRFWDNARRGMRGNAAQATSTTTGTFPAPAELTELRLDGLLTGRVRLIGEARADIAYELTVESTGPDRETALGYTKRVVMKRDDLGNVVTLRLEYPREARQSAVLLIRLPSRMGVLVANASGSEISNLKSAHLDGVTGDWTVSRIAEGLTGSHRNGSLKASDIGSVKLGLQRSRASFDQIAGAATLDVRDGECRITDVKGAVELDETRAEIAITNSGDVVRVGGSDGQVTLVHPSAESKIDVRRAAIEVQLADAVPLTLLTTNDTLRLVLSGPPNVTLDALTNQARIDASDFGLQAETSDQDARLAHTFGARGAPRVSLRNSRGDILIKNFRGAIVNPDRK